MRFFNKILKYLLQELYFKLKKNTRMQLFKVHELRLNNIIVGIILLLFIHITCVY